MTGVHIRRVLVAAIAVAPFALAIRSSPVSAACTTGTSPSASVSGVVVSTSIAPDFGVIVDVRTDGGTTRQVGFWGRNPANTLAGGAENTVEDAWAGDLPNVGGRYRITGDFNGEGQPITVSKCAQTSSVEVLVAPPTKTVVAAIGNQGGRRGYSTSALVGIAVAIGLGVAALAFVLRRRSRPSHA